MRDEGREVCFRGESLVCHKHSSNLNSGPWSFQVRRFFISLFVCLFVCPPSRQLHFFFYSSPLPLCISVRVCVCVFVCLFFPCERSQQRWVICHANEPMCEGQS